MVVLTALIVSGTYVAVDQLLSDLFHVSKVLDQTIEATAIALAAAAALWFAVIGPLRREADAERQLTLAREDALRADSRRQDFQGALHRAVEMAGTEHAVYEVTAKAIGHGTGREDAELLLADSSEAHLKSAVAVGGSERLSRCEVETPRDCPAIRRAQTLTFASSEDLDACPHLENRPDGPCGAVCVPVSVGGRSIGVLHAANEPDSLPTASAITALEAIATQAGTRIGMLRVMAATHLQAATDPLTGLLNRRSFENRAHQLIQHGRPFALAMGDLDHFKMLNDAHGHDAGDRALRVFAQTLRSVLRADDLTCRYGGEEFVILLPGRSVNDAAAALGRIQQELLVAVTGGAVPPFTVSFGLTHSDQDIDLEGLCRLADTALYRAKREGRNRVVFDRHDGQADAEDLVPAPDPAPATT